MPLIATEGESKPKQLPPPGTHVARCYSVIDLGTQPGTFGPKRKIRITWELPDETAVFQEDKGPQPFVVSKEYTLSLYEKANLRHDLESWRGKQFTTDELKGFDIFTLIDVPCLLTIIHKTKEGGGKTYANVSSISKLAKGMTVSARINPLVRYSIDDKSNTVFLSLPEWMRKKIEEAEEWNESAVTEERERDPFDEDGDGEPIPF